MSMTSTSDSTVILSCLLIGVPELILLLLLMMIGEKSFVPCVLCTILGNGLGGKLQS